jgi:hypothetical protein
MMFDPNNGAAVRRAKLLIGGAWLLALSIWGAIAYVAIHFITKYW